MIIRRRAWTLATYPNPDEAAVFVVRLFFQKESRRGEEFLRLHPTDGFREAMDRERARADRGSKGCRPCR